MVTLLAYGSPPHMRGMPARTAFFCSSIGSPPRMRGKSSLPQTETCRCGAPPRMRGTVLLCVIPVGMPPHGSPPRVRGKGGRVTFTLILSGSTPAYAGKRSVTKPRRTKRTDHPRPCGEKLSTKDFIAPPSGSPPRMREKVEDKVREYKAQRITPAYAGKSATTTWARTVGGDHPRVCGEKARAAAWACVTYGSPPRVRGKDAAPAFAVAAGRITPACAGKRGPARVWRDSFRDHPRVCGEKTLS